MIVCRDEDAVRERCGLINDGIGVCYARTGRRFLNDAAVEAEFLQRINAAIEPVGPERTAGTTDRAVAERILRMDETGTPLATALKSS